jgi:manganese transport protein
MPHNLYLHSALVQTRSIGATADGKRSACRYNFVDSFVALNAALLVNAAILIVAASVFFQRGVVVTEIQQAHHLLAPLVGTAAASVLFAVALLCAGQSSTLTGTLAGQIVMEGFLNIRVRPWLRRLVTRAIAIVPAALTIAAAGDRGTYKLLILSQVILSMQLPFAVIPLIHFTSDRGRMGGFANRLWVKLLAWVTAAVIVGLNVRLVITAIGEWIAGAGEWRWLVELIVFPVALGLAGLLGWVAFEPLLRKWLRRRFGREPLVLPEHVVGEIAAPAYRRILVPLDHSGLDRAAIAHAAALAAQHKATLYLLHVEEGVTSQVYGALSSTAEVEAGQRYLDEIAGSLRAQGMEVETQVFHASSPKTEIVRYAGEIKPDLLIMGAHGHHRFKDLIFGDTINPVRHAVDAPILIVRG